MANFSLSNIFKGDKVIWMIFFFLCLISVIEVYTSSPQITYKTGNYIAPMIKHCGLLLLGVAAMVVTLNVKCGYFKVLTPFMLALSFGLMIWLFLTTKEATNEATRWTSILGVQFQPSEIAKGSLVLATARILSAMQTGHGADPKAMKYILVICAFLVTPIALENLSTGVLICLVIFIMMFIGQVPRQQLGKLLGVAVLSVATVVALTLLLGNEKKAEADKQAQKTEMVAGAGKDTAEKGKKEKTLAEKIFHRFDTWKSRIYKFLDNKEVKPSELNYDDDQQVIFANISIVQSNIIGKGPGSSTGCITIPQAFSDFIFAIIIEEMGLLGAIFVAVLYIVLLFRTGRIASRCENTFPAMLAMGFALLIVTQALFNMAVAVGLAPVTGQPLPLISKGGTSSIINCIYIGVILSVSRTAQKRMETVGNQLVETVEE